MSAQLGARTGAVRTSWPVLPSACTVPPARCLAARSRGRVETRTPLLTPVSALSAGAGAFGGDAADRGPRTVDAVRRLVSTARNDAATAERRRLWMAAIKPPMYSVGIIPAMVAAAAVYAETGMVAWRTVLTLSAAATCMVAWINLSNDAFDATTGVDKTKPESIVNLTGNRGAVLLAAKLFLAAGAWLLAGCVGGAHGGRVAGMMAAAVACGYLYQGPPFRLSYKGLGEPLVFLVFGPLVTASFYLALAPHREAAAAAAAAPAGLLQWAAAAVPGGVWAASALVGVTTASILFCSHFHQVAGDSAAGKRSPLVRLGTGKGTRVLSAAVVGTYAFAVAAAAAGALPLAVPLFALASVPAARALVAYAEANHTVPAAIAPLKFFAIRWHVAFSTALIAGLIAQGLA